MSRDQRTTVVPVWYLSSIWILQVHTQVALGTSTSRVSEETFRYSVSGAQHWSQCLVACLILALEPKKPLAHFYPNLECHRSSSSTYKTSSTAPQFIQGLHGMPLTRMSGLEKRKYLRRSVIMPTTQLCVGHHSAHLPNCQPTASQTVLR